MFTDIPDNSSWKDRVDNFAVTLIQKFAQDYIESHHMSIGNEIHVINALLTYSRQKGYITNTNSPGFEMQFQILSDQSLNDFEIFFQKEFTESALLKFLKDNLMNDITKSKILYDPDKDKVQKYLENYLNNFFAIKESNDEIKETKQEINVNDLIKRTDKSVTFDLPSSLKILQRLINEKLPMLKITAEVNKDIDNLPQAPGGPR